MSLTLQGRQLTEAHRVAQLQISAETTQLVLDTWDLLDPDDVDGSTEAWLRVTRREVANQHGKSAAVAAAYFQVFRQVELGRLERFEPLRVAPIGRQFTTSLMVTGPVTLRRLLRSGVPPAQAKSQGVATLAGAAVRLALAGSRDTLVETVKADPRALGWSRVTSGSPCAFCAMLASRGPVYVAEDSAGFEPHDRCGCQPEAVFSRQAEWPPGAREYRDQWDRATEGLSGQDAVNAFRRSLTGGDTEE